jgi:2,3-bisphosphoglycerate-independent phosphoglycerate mutase
MKIYIIVVDGGADRHIPELGGTPWEVARTPVLDRLAAKGAQGLVDIIPGIAPESDSGCMALLGFDPRKYYTGRGPLEGLGAGFLDGDGSHVCFRCNFASWDASTGILNRRTSRDLTQCDLDALVAEMKQGVRLEMPFDVEFDMIAYGAHRGLLSFHSKSATLGGAVTNTDPLFANAGPFGIPVGRAPSSPLPCRPRSDAREDAITAEIVNQFVAKSAVVLEKASVNLRRRELGRLPANLLIVRDGGNVPPKLESFEQTFGRTVSFHGQIPAERGLMRLLGGRYVDAAAKPHEPEELFYSRVLSGILSDEADVCVIHLVKGSDEAGHDGDGAGKVQALENFDTWFLAPLVQQLPADATIVVTSDHATPCSLRIHSADPVPTLVVGPGISADGIRSFGETQAARGGGPNGLAGHQLLPWIMERIRR